MMQRVSYVRQSVERTGSAGPSGSLAKALSLKPAGSGYLPVSGLTTKRSGLLGPHD